MEQAGFRSSRPEDGEPNRREEPESAVDCPPQVNGQPPETGPAEEVEIGGGGKCGKDPPLAGHLGQPENPEDADQWEAIACPVTVYTMTRSTAALSFATVQWDMPEASLGRADLSDPRSLESMEEEEDDDDEEEEEVMAGLEDVPTLRPSSKDAARPERRAPQVVAVELDWCNASTENIGDVSGVRTTFRRRRRPSRLAGSHFAFANRDVCVGVDVWPSCGDLCRGRVHIHIRDTW